MKDCVDNGDAEDQISPSAIPHCELCGVRNFSIGGRTSDGRFHPAYVPADAAHVRLAPKLGRRGWCGHSAPDHFVSIVRIICRPVRVVGSAGDETMNLCERCAHVVVSQQARESEEAAA